MHTLFQPALLLNLVLLAAVWWFSPPSMAVHFAPGGQADGWMHKDMATLFNAVIIFVVYLSLHYSTRIAGKLPERWLTMPNGKYWLGAERRVATLANLQQRIDAYGTATLLFTAWSSWLQLAAQRRYPAQLDIDAFAWGAALFALYSVLWLQALIRAFWRKPH